MKSNHKSVLGTAAALLLSFLSQSTLAEAPPPGLNGISMASQSDVTAPVEPRYEPELRSRTLMATAVSACDMSGYADKSGQALVDHILQSEQSCINDLYDGNATSFAAFTQQHMLTVASAAADMADTYSAAAGDSSINKLYYFLRTGFYIEYYYPEDVGPFGDQVQEAVTQALDSFIANPDFYDSSSSHGDAISDAIILMDSANEQTRYLPVVKEWLQRWDPNYAQHRSLRGAVNGIFTILFRGRYDDTFVDTAGDDQELMQLLGAFARSDWMLDSDALFMQENAGRELSRFLQHTSAPAFDTVVDEVDRILTRYSMDGTGSSVWLVTASNADYFGQCETFGICGFAEELEQQVLGNNHTCSSTIKIRAQDMTQAQMTDSCDELGAQETYFHQMLSTNYNPVADDLNQDLEVVVFDNWDEYNSYAPLFFGISTDNGGMYLEGDPTNPDNQARFIAHEADWLPEFEVWNLTHEYVHYLDGRFNLYGDFGAAQTGTHKTVWWIEGLAEYISKRDYNDDAIAQARTGQYNLSEIFANDYSSGTERVYRWGYLAVRFMFERHRGDVTQILTYLRAGNYDGYLDYINSIGGSYDGEWQTWLTQVQSTQDDSGSDNEIGNNETISGLAVSTQGEDLHYYIDVPAGASQLSVAIDGGSGDADLYVRYGKEATDTEYTCRPYIGGNTEVCDVDQPQAGRWYIRLKAYQAFADVSLIASYSVTTDACASGTPLEYGELELGAASCVAGSNGIRYFYVYVPDGTAALEFALSGGDGNADLYVNDETWATESDYDQVSNNTGNSENLSVPSPDSGWYYVSVIGNGDFSDTTLRVTAN